MPGTTTNRSIPIIRRLLPGLSVIPLLMLSVCAHPLQAGSGPPRPEVPKGQKHEMRHEIDHLEEAWREAVLKRDTAALNSMLADDYMGISATGLLQTKEQTIANLHNGQLQIKGLEISDRKVRFYGKTALITSLAEVRGTSEDGDVTGSYRYTHVYVRDVQGVWRIVSFEASRIREPR
jgi:ketosteroid isomerase-like protein